MTITAGTAQFSTTGRAAPAAKPYDPRYDPLVASDPGAGRAYAPTWWVASAGAPPEDDGPVLRDIDVDVAIIGSGATGMSTALYLAQEHGIPIFEDVALARSMYKQVSVDSVIPAKFYQAVAELVRIVYSNKAQRKGIS